MESYEKRNESRPAPKKGFNPPLEGDKSAKAPKAPKAPIVPHKTPKKTEVGRWEDEGGNPNPAQDDGTNSGNAVGSDSK